MEQKKWASKSLTESSNISKNLQTNPKPVSQDIPTTAQIRQSFQDFFAEKDHKIVPSASLLPTSPNLLFTNAGMNQFVPCFLGERKPAHPRIADTQKCIRAGGKHNDLEDVGLDTYHHTLFEMLGNWSFGDYFKKEAIEWAWDLMVNVWKFPKERLYATIYKPGPNDPAEEDLEAREIWAEIFRKENLDPEIHICTGEKKDNFWMMGETGPCGPCSELHIDLTPEGDTKGSLVNEDSPWCIEIWNLVFIQYNAQPDGSFAPLKENHVDTGMGLERVAGILATTENFTNFNSAPSNYNSDIFTRIFDRISEFSEHTYSATLPEDPHNPTEKEFVDIAFRVLADHIRALTLSIADGIHPGNEGRNYVLRRILRRALMYSRRIDLPDGTFSKLTPTVIETLGEAFPELEQQKETIIKVLQNEERAFEKTLRRGLQLLDKIAADGVKEISGENAFLLYDTYGFPLDLTQLVAKDKNLAVDLAGFEVEMEKQRERARGARKTETISISTGDSESEATRFTGFEDTFDSSETTIQDLHNDDKGTYIILPQTPFYAEMGGQIGDRGSLEIDGQVYTVTDTIQDAAGRHLHKVKENGNQLQIGQPVIPKVNLRLRDSIQAHHTATHLLNWALRDALGTHIRQAGSLVEGKKLRFDFTHYEAVSKETLQELEERINKKILENDSIDTFETSFSEKPDDVIATFGEKYGDVVRVVDIGGYSKELCGGCHTKSTSQLGLFKIQSESSIAAGTRRIEAVTQYAAHEYCLNSFQLLQNLSASVSCPTEKLEDHIEKLMEQNKELQAIINAANKAKQNEILKYLESQIFVYEDLRILAVFLENQSPRDLQQISKSAFSRYGLDVLLLGGNQNGKIFFNSFCSSNATSKGYKAGDLVRSILSKVGAKGGGKPDSASGGGPDNGQLPTVLENIKKDPATGLA